VSSFVMRRSHMTFRVMLKCSKSLACESPDEANCQFPYLATPGPEVALSKSVKVRVVVSDKGVQVAHLIQRAKVAPLFSS